MLALKDKLWEAEVSKEELKEMLKHLGTKQKMPQDEIDLLVGKVDNFSMKPVCNFERFCDSLVKDVKLEFFQKSQQRELKRMIQDKNWTGKVTLDDLKFTIATLGEDYTQKLISEMMEGANANSVVEQGGEIDLKAFFMEQRQRDWKNMQVILIYFAYSAKIVWNEPLSVEITDDVFTRSGWFTYIGPPLQEAFKELDKVIADKTSAHLYLFTDGECEYPTSYLKAIEETMKKNKEAYRNKDPALKNRSKLSIYLMCEGKMECLKSIDEKLNEIFENECQLDQSVSGKVCQIKGQVNPEQIGERFVEAFTFGGD